MSSGELNDVIELSDIMLAHVEKRMAAEQEHLLEIVRNMPLDKFLASGQKSFAVARDDRVHVRRKK